jgi:hypothetical protein
LYCDKWPLNSALASVVVDTRCVLPLMRRNNSAMRRCPHYVVGVGKSAGTPLHQADCASLLSSRHVHANLSLSLSLSLSRLMAGIESFNVSASCLKQRKYSPKRSMGWLLQNLERYVHSLRWGKCEAETVGYVINARGEMRHYCQ